MNGYGNRDVPSRKKNHFAMPVNVVIMSSLFFARANGCTSYNQLLNKKLISSAVRLGFLKRLNGEWIKFYHRGYGGLIAGMTMG
jgi:hypothetical protein